jgi:hypothetical protein
LICPQLKRKIENNKIRVEESKWYCFTVIGLENLLE